jgi:hypothetical protein
MSLVTFPLRSGESLDLQHDPCPSVIRTWSGTVVALPEGGTHYGFVLTGEAVLSRDGTSRSAYTLSPGMYFALPQSGSIGGADSTGFVVTRLDVSFTAARPMFSLGGPMESQGRFSYINGGTDTLLLPPIQLGDPCLNALYFPPHVDQTLHTHPSYRCGVVVSGAGLCHTPETSVAFEPGSLFVIGAEQLHRFQTIDEPLVLAVFHPDSDTGFTHNNHPMLRRTFVDGISAIDLPELQTPRPIARP